MKKIKILFLIALSISLFGINYCKSQTFTVIKATSQRWAGGVVGHSGINYYITLETSSKIITPDTVWIDGNVYPIDFTVKDGSAYRTIDSVTHKIKFSLVESESNNNLRSPPYMRDTATQKPKKTVRQFEGAAMISYRVKHKQRFFIVQSFTRLPQLNYP